MKDKLWEYSLVIVLIIALAFVFTGSYWLDQIHIQWQDEHKQEHPHIQSDDEIKEHLFDDYEDGKLQYK